MFLFKLQEADTNQTEGGDSGILLEDEFSLDLTKRKKKKKKTERTDDGEEEGDKDDLGEEKDEQRCGLCLCHLEGTGA